MEHERFINGAVLPSRSLVKLLVALLGRLVELDLVAVGHICIFGRSEAQISSPHYSIFILFLLE